MVWHVESWFELSCVNSVIAYFEKYSKTVAHLSYLFEYFQYELFQYESMCYASTG